MLSLLEIVYKLQMKHLSNIGRVQLILAVSGLIGYASATLKIKPQLNSRKRQKLCIVRLFPFLPPDNGIHCLGVSHKPDVVERGGVGLDRPAFLQAHSTSSWQLQTMDYICRLEML